MINIEEYHLQGEAVHSFPRCETNHKTDESVVKDGQSWNIVPRTTTNKMDTRGERLPQPLNSRTRANVFMCIFRAMY